MYLHWSDQQMAGENTLNLVLKRMLEHVLKTHPVKEILEFEDWKKGTKPIRKKIQTTN